MDTKTAQKGLQNEQNRLGQSDLYVSAMGLGCMSLGTDKTHAAAIIHEALEQGINFLDTADLYDEGRNEEIIGNAVRHRRADVILATKVGNRRIPGKEGWSWDPSKAYIKSAVKRAFAGCRQIISISISCTEERSRTPSTRR